MPPQPVNQGDPNMTVVRNHGPHVRGYFDGSGIFRADSVADDGNVVYADGGVQAGVSNQPPGLARIAAPLVADPNQPVPPRLAGFGEMTAVQQREAVKQAAIAMGFEVRDAPVEVRDSPSAFAVVASDAGSNDPRDMGGAPKVFSASDLPQIKRREIVPVTIAVAPAAAGAPPAPKARKGGRK